LTGGISAAMTALEIALPDGARRTVVVRQSPVPRREFRTLHIARAHGRPVPEPLLLDVSGQILPAPYLILAYVAGTPAFAPADRIALAREMADPLARIHSVDGADPALAFLPRQVEAYAARLHWRLQRPPAQRNAALREGQILDALASRWPLRARNAPALLHGDFWPGNVLWRQGQVAAIVDWEDAQIGDPLADLAISRLDLTWIMGREAMEAFTRRYLAQIDIDDTDLPYWDLAAALRLIRLAGGQFAAWASFFHPYGREDITEETMQADYDAFVARAFQAMARRQR
jgi:aminoglycoside phosphotransferase (APT) family kinase protein